MSESSLKAIINYFAILGSFGCVIWIFSEWRQVEPYVAFIGSIAGLISIVYPSGNITLAVRCVTHPSKKAFWVLENLGDAVAHDVQLKIKSVPDIISEYFPADFSPYDQTVYGSLFPILTLGPGEQQLLPMQPDVDWPQNGCSFDISIECRRTPKGPLTTRNRRMIYYGFSHHP